MFSNALRTAAHACRNNKLKTSVVVGSTSSYGLYYQWQQKKEEQRRPVLVIPLNEIEIVERKKTPSQILSDNVVELRDLIETIKAANKDDRIPAIRLDGNNGSFDDCGLADLEEIHRAFSSVKMAKETAVISSFRNIHGIKSLYLTRDTYTCLHPEGVVSPAGLDDSSFYIQPFLQKHGIKIDVFRHGEFKSAPSTFSANGSTRAERENNVSVHDSLHEIMWKGALNMDPEASEEERARVVLQVRELFKHVGLNVKEAQELGLVQQLQDDEYRKEIGDVQQITLSEYMARLNKAKVKKARWERLKAYSKQVTTSMSHQSHSLAFGDHGDYTSCDGDGYDCNTTAKPAGMKNGDGRGNRPVVPIVYVDGEISQKKADTIVGCLQGIRKAIDNGAPVKHVVLRVSSPGGAATASKIIAAELERLQVPWTVSFGNSAASGGYLISAGADKIFSNEMSRTGSIGAYMLRFDLSGALKKLGINVEHIDGPSTSGMFWQQPFAGNSTNRDHASNVLRPTTYGMREYLSKRCTEIYEEFKSHVAKGRNLTLPEVEKLAQGRVYTGAQAKDVGLVDEVGGLEEALQYVYEKHDIQEEDTIVLELPSPEPLSLSDIVTHALTENQMSANTGGWMSRMSSSLAFALGMGGASSNTVHTPPTAMEDLDLIRWAQGMSSIKQQKDLAAVNASTDVMLLADDKAALDMAMKQLSMD